MNRAIVVPTRLAAATLAAWLLVATPAPAAGAPPATRDDAVAAYVAAWNGSGDALEPLLAPGFTDRSALLPADAALFRMQLAAWRAAIPDLRVTLLERTSADGIEVLRLQYAGRLAEPPALLPHGGDTVRIEQTERLQFRDGRLAMRQASIDDWTLPPDWLFVPPPAMPVDAAAIESIAELGKGRFLESIVVGKDGTLFVSTGFEGGIVKVGRDGAVSPYATVDVGPGGYLMCLTFGPDGALYASVNSRLPDVVGVWRFDHDGQGRRIGALLPGATPNGITTDGRGGLLVADTFGGIIWRMPATGGDAQPWLRHAWLAPRPLVGRFPGANGLQRHGDAVFVAVSDRSLLLRVPIAADGAAGEPVVLSASLPGDDFAVDADGTLYVTTHPFNTVVRLGPDGRPAVIAGPAQGVIGPTAAALGDDGWLYVVTDGGLFRPLPGVEPRAAILRLRVGTGPDR